MPLRKGFGQMNNSLITYTLSAILLCSLLIACNEQSVNVSTKDLPSGIYHSASPISSSNAVTVINEQYTQNGFVSGTLLRVAWEDIHLEEETFDFTLIDAEFEAAAEQINDISLVIYDSKTTPAFILDRCETFEFIDREGINQLTCLPWDLEYLRLKQQLLTALGQKYDHSEFLKAIYMSYSAMTNGIEMHWRVSEDEFTAAGYTQERLIDAYNSVMDLYIEAFPNTAIIMEIHNVFFSPFLAEAGFDHCYGRIGNRCGVAMWWCAERITNESESDVWPIAQLASELSFSVCQTVASYTLEPDKFDNGDGWSPLEALQNDTSFFLNNGITVWELWSADVLNDDFETELLLLNESINNVH